jgi:hypothetical protein
MEKKHIASHAHTLPRLLTPMSPQTHREAKGSIYLYTSGISSSAGPSLGFLGMLYLYVEYCCYLGQTVIEPLRKLCVSIPSQRVALNFLPAL